MRKLLPLLLFSLFTFQTHIHAQLVCPAVTTNNVALSCSTPCATLSVTPTVNLAATTSYSISSIPYVPYSLTGGTDVLFAGSVWAAATDDTYGPITNIPFNFCFFGNTYNRMVIGTNGNLTFNTALAGAYDPYPISGPLTGSNSNATYNAIMATWNDTYAGGGGTIRYATYGVAPCRQFVVTWNNNELYLPGTYCTGIRYTGQAVLYESTNIIDIFIGTRTSCAAWNSGLAVVGIEDNPGTTFYSPAGRNGTTFNTTNEGWRFTPTGAVSGWTYAWHGPGGTTVGTTPAVTVCPSVTTVYTVVATSVACTGVSVQTTSTVTTTGSLTPITGPTTMCVGGTVALTDATVGGSWSSGTTSVATVGLTSGIVTGVSGGTAVITYSAIGCTATRTVTVIQPGPITGTTTVCAGGTTTLTDSPAGGTWSSSNTSIATIGLSSGTVSGISPGTSVVTYTVGTGCTATATITVVTLSPITGNTTLCQGATTTLSNSGAGGTWVSGNLPVATINPSTGMVTGVSPGTAPITYTIAGGCRTTTTVTINPVLPITGVPYLCQRGTTTLSNAGTGGTWSSGTPTIATVGSTTPVVHGVSGGTDIITYTSGFGCISTITITVYPTPPPPGVTPKRYCQFATPIPALIATGLAGATFTWYGPGVTAGYTTPPVPSSAVPGIDTYYVTQTSTFGCVSDSARQLDTIIAKPSTPLTRDTAYCQYFGAPASLDLEVTATGTLNWYQGGILLSGAPVPSTSTPTYPAGTVWYVSQTVNGCEGDSAAVNVQIIYLPDFTISGQPWVCQLDSISLAYTTSGPPLIGGGLLWSLPPGAFFAGGTGPTDATIVVKFDSVGSSNYVYLTANNLGGQCKSSDTIRIDVIGLPTANSATKADVCMSDTVLLALSSKSLSALDFTWLVDNTPLFSSGALTIIAANSDHGGPFSIRWDDTGKHFISVQATAAHGCTSKPTVDTVDVHALPDASFRITTLGGTLCLEDSVLFSANDSNYQNIYWWTPEHFFNNVGKHAIWGKVELERSIVTLKVTDPFGCVATSSRELDPSVCCNVPFPNCFTPNGDNLNDVFRPIPMRAFHRYHIFRIANRWGQTVFETTNNKAEWDGNFNGVPQDMGVYYYYLKYDCDGKTMEQKGDCTLIR